MASRININRVPQSYTPVYDVPRPRSDVQDNSSFQDDPVAKIRATASKVEDFVDIYSQPLRPHLPAIGRFLIVLTFLEDALRIITQWSDQIWYLQRYACAFFSIFARRLVHHFLDTAIVLSRGALAICFSSSTSSYAGTE